MTDLMIAGSPTASETQAVHTVEARSYDLPQFPGLLGTFMGRDALSLAVSYLGLTENDTVLLPVYTCQDVLRSFVRKCNVVFYDVRRDLTIDPDEMRSRLRGKERVRMALITNYFGFLQPCRNEIKQICAEKDICLIEDCAHSLLTEGSGETGHLSTYSLRKILPIRDGGGLRFRGDGEAPVPKYHPGLYADTLSFLAFAKSLLKMRSEKFSRARVSSQAAQVFPLPSKNSRVLPLSDFARRSLKKIPLEEVAKKRRADFQFWQAATRDNPELVPIFEELPFGVCPLGFPILTKNRQSLESRARKMGISLRVHWRLDPTLGSECGTSHRLSGEMLTLPIYPELAPQEREVLAGLLARRQ